MLLMERAGVGGQLPGLLKGTAPDTGLHRLPCVLWGGTRDVKAPPCPQQTMSSRPFEPQAPSHSLCSLLRCPFTLSG